MGTILVIGCVSLDVIHLEQGGERTTFHTVGGAGLFTALAAARTGAEVTLYAPRPAAFTSNIATHFQNIETMLTWVGPEVEAEKMPRLEIVHHGNGKATLLGADWGAEPLMTVDNLTDTTHGATYDTVHVAALSTASKQLAFIRHCRAAGLSPLLSAGTYARSVSADRETVLDLLRACNYFFLNTNEASMLFDGGKVTAAPGQKIFVTDGANGADYYHDGLIDHIAADAADELDPTGAGDTLCGATLAGIAAGMDVHSAANAAAILAARVIEKPGSQFYF